ncbi:MAG TPA: DUF3592 domain-containing protein [Longimicrobiaceae bacterium]|nr:DUF3592 domain-containing protein [Longimicrobiaceae bacterium]
MVRDEIVWASGMVALSAWAAWKSGRALGFALRSRAWPRAPGEILDAGVVHAARKEGVTRYAQQWIGESIRYRYRVGGRWWYSERVRFTDLAVWSSRRTVSRYPAGAAVEVVYDPADTARSALEPGPTLLGWLEPVGSVLALALGTAWLRYAILSG